MAIPCITELLDLVRRHQLLSAQQMEQLRSLEADPRALAQEIIRRGWLTPYQMNQVFQGRAEELFLGPYLIQERLGEGGTGQVFKACHRQMRRQVALKLIRRELLTDAEVMNRFLREIQVVSQLTHPNIVHAYDAGPVGPTYFLAMEYVKGTDLAGFVKRSGPLGVSHACNCIRQAALGLQHAHARGLVHRDIKPPNLMLTKGRAGSAGVVKILDLGLARLQKPADGEKTSLLTPAGPVMMGTPDYLAPEQALNFHEVDIRADIYSLGCTFYYLLTGRPPFAGGSLAQKLLMHQQAIPVPLEQLRPEVPAEVGAVVLRMLAKSPGDRFQTPAELVAALDDLLPSARAVVRAEHANGTSHAVRTDLRRGGELSLKHRGARTIERILTPGRRRWQLWLAAAVATVVPVGLVLVLAAGRPVFSGRESPSAPAAGLDDWQPEAEWKALVNAWNTVGVNREQLRPALLQFQRKHPGTGEARQVARLLRQLASPLDRLDGEALPAERSRGWPSPELVAYLGEPKRSTPPGRVAFSPDGRWLASSVHDGGVRLWEMPKGVERAPFATQHRPARFVFTPDSQTLAVFGGPEATMSLWDLSGEQPRQRAVLGGHTQPVQAAVVTPDGKLLVSAGAEGTVRLWNLTNRHAPGCGRLEHPTDGIVALACSPDGKRLVALASGGHTHTWDLGRRPPRYVSVSDAPQCDVFAQLAFDPESTALVVAGVSKLRWYEFKGTELASRWTQSFGRLMSMAMAPDGQTVAGTVGNGRLIFFEPASGAHRRVWHLPVATHSIDFAPDGRHVAVACPGDSAAILRLAGLPK